MVSEAIDPLFPTEPETQMSGKSQNVKKLDIQSAPEIFKSSTRRIKATQKTIITSVKGWGVRINVTETDTNIEQIGSTNDEWH
jgi:hypothetical protein